MTPARRFFESACSSLYKLQVLPSRANRKQLRALRRDLFESVDANEDGVLSFPEVYRWADSSLHTRELMEGFSVAALDDDDPRKIEVVTRRTRLATLGKQAAAARRRCRRWSAPGHLCALAVCPGGSVVGGTGGLLLDHQAAGG